MGIQNSSSSSREPLLFSDKGRSQWSYQPEKKQRDHPDAILGITRATYKSSPTVSDVTRNVSTSSSTISERTDVTRNVPTSSSSTLTAPRKNVPIKKADREEEKKVPSSTVSLRKDAPINVPVKKADREEEKKVVSVGKDAPRYVRILGTKKADPEEKKKVSCKELSTAPRNVSVKKADRQLKKKDLTSSSTPTVSVGKDAPRNVSMKKAVREEKKKELPSSTVSIRKNTPRYVIVGTKKADREEEEEEEKKVSCTSSSTVSVGKDAPSYDILGTKKADPEEKKKVSCKETSTVSVGNDVPRNVSVKKADRELKKELTSSSTVSVAPRNVSMKKADREEKKELPSSTVSIRKNTPRYVIVGTKKAEENCKELTSSSTVSVGKDAPSYVIAGMKKADPEEEKKESCKVLTSSSTLSVNVPFLEEENNNKNRTRGRRNKKVSLIKSSIIIERWIQHYSSRHRILLVGEGDFSFSASLALAFSSASNIIATSLDSQEFLLENYSRAASNLEELRSRESEVMHEIDATKMAKHPSLRHLKFDRIIFNFPYAGLANIKNLPLQAELRSHRRLVSQFLKNAREMISEDGEIHISHKTNKFHKDFMIESIASSHKLRLIEAVNFNNLEYPGYNTKCGFGGDKNFNFHPSKTFKFCIKNFDRMVKNAMYACVHGINGEEHIFGCTSEVDKREDHKLDHKEYYPAKVEKWTASPRRELVIGTVPINI